MKLKYQTYLQALSDCTCPPPSATRGERKGVFRFVHEPIDKTSFVPPALCDPRRISGEVSVGCSDYALSMFATAQGAKNKYMRPLPELHDCRDSPPAKR